MLNTATFKQNNNWSQLRLLGHTAVEIKDSALCGLRMHTHKHMHAHTHLKSNSWQPYLLAFTFVVLSSTIQQCSSLPSRIETHCHCYCLNPTGFTGQLAHWRMQRVPWGQCCRQTYYSWLITPNSLLLIRKVIITLGTVTRSVLIYNEAFSGEASKHWIHLGSRHTVNTL